MKLTCYGLYQVIKISNKNFFIDADTRRVKISTGRVNPVHTITERNEKQIIQQKKKPYERPIIPEIQTAKRKRPGRAERFTNCLQLGLAGITNINKRIYIQTTSLLTRGYVPVVQKTGLTVIEA